MFSADTRNSFSEFLENLDWDVRGQHVCRVKRKWAKAKKRLRFRGCRPPRPWEKGYRSLRPYNLAPAAPFPSLFPAMAAWSARDRKPAMWTAHAFRPIPGVLTSDDIAAVAERTHAIMRGKMDDLERNILSGGLL